MKTKKPILVTGSYRSGTTWIGRTISQHPRIRYVHEPFNVSHPNKAIGLKLDTWFLHAPSSIHMEEIYKSFDNLFKLSSLTYAARVCKRAGIDIKTPARFSKHFLLELFFRPRILVKDPLALFSAEWLHEIFDFQVIVMIRNPYAFVGSLKAAGWDFDFENLRKQNYLMKTWLSQFSDRIESMCIERDSYDLIDRAALLWSILHFVIQMYQAKYTDWLFVKHEDIAMDPKPGFNNIYNHLGLKLDGKIMEYIENFTSENNPKVSTSSKYQPRNSKLSLYTWRNRLSDDEIERVKIATRDIASMFYSDMY